MRQIPAAKRNSGYKAKKMGELFESIFESACRRRHVNLIRIPSGCRMIGPQKIILVKSPFDYILTHSGTTVLLDVKTCEEKAFPNSKITDHQLHHLLGHQNAGGSSGYAIWFRSIDAIFFFPAFVLEAESKRKGSLKIDTPGAVHLGSSSSIDIFKIFKQPVALKLQEETKAQDGPTRTDQTA